MSCGLWFICTISIHAPTNGATHKTFLCQQGLIFQSTLRRTERHVRFAVKRHFILFQSTLRRTERQCSRHPYQPHTDISIHAPTNGATTDQQHYWQRPDNFNPRSDERSDFIPLGATYTSLISIHAPTNGATLVLVNHRHLRKYFNPRSDERSDVTQHIHLISNVISIHAPTNGATLLL